MTFVRFSMLLLATALVLGCGSKGPELVPVKGTVTLDGAPLAYKTVEFVPDTGTAGGGAGGSTKNDGSFELLASVGGSVVDMKGAPVGSYRVVVKEPMFPIEEDLAVQGKSGEADVAIGLPDMAATRPTQSIPSVYTSPDTTPLRAQVAAGSGDIQLELSSRP